MEKSDKLEVLEMLIRAITERDWAWEEDLIEQTAIARLERILTDAFRNLSEAEDA